MRVLLVNPPRSPHNAIYDHAPQETKRFIHQKLIGPPLGLLTLATALDGHEVALLELKGEYDLRPDAPEPEQLLESWLLEVRPKIVGVTFIASEHPAGMELLRAVKRHDPEIVTVAGGLHAILCPEDFDDPAVDVVVRAQAPQVFREVVDALEVGSSLDSIGGLQLRSEQGLAPTTAEPRSFELAGADYLRPDRSLIRPWLQSYRVGKGAGPATYLFTSLGCPHRCSFCSIWPQYGGLCHQRSVESIVEELTTLDEYEVVRFADANTLIDVGFAERLFDRIEAEGIEKHYVMDIRVDTAVAHPRLIERMGRAGLKVAISGFESFRDAELERYGKKLAASRIQEAVEVFHGAGVMVRGNYVIPPDYVEADFDALAEFASAHSVALAGYTILSPMPGTPFHDEVKDRIVDRDLSKYNFFNCVLETALPLERFYERVGDLWRVRLGTEVI